MADSIERLSFELTLGAVAEQERSVTGLRNCAGTVLGAASIAGSFLGARLEGQPLDDRGVLATVAFALCFGSAIWVLVPRDLGLSFRGGFLTEVRGQDRELDDEDGYRAMCAWMEPQLELNGRQLDRLGEWLTVSCLLLAIEIILWTISLTG